MRRGIFVLMSRGIFAVGLIIVVIGVFFVWQFEEELEMIEMQRSNPWFIFFPLSSQMSVDQRIATLSDEMTLTTFIVLIGAILTIIGAVLQSKQKLPSAMR